MMLGRQVLGIFFCLGRAFEKLMGKPLCCRWFAKKWAGLSEAVEKMRGVYPWTTH